MPKTIKEIKQFVRGTVTHPSEADIDPDAASNSLNIDPNSRDGLLGGINEDAVDIELLSNQGDNFVDVQAQPGVNTCNTLSISNLFSLDISSVVSGKTDYIIRGYETNTGIADISEAADELKGNVLFIVVPAKLSWLTASNSKNGTGKPYNHFVGITSHIDAHATVAVNGGGIDLNWWKGIWEAKFPVEWTTAQTDPLSEDHGFKGNYIQFADDDGWLTGSIIRNGAGHTVFDTGTANGTPEGTYYAMPIMLFYADGTPKNTVSIKNGSSEHLAINCYQTTVPANIPVGTPNMGWGPYEDLGSAGFNKWQPGGQDWGFGIYQPYVSINDWSGLDGVTTLKDKSNEVNRVLVDKTNKKVHYHSGLDGTTYQNQEGLGTKYPTTAKISSFDLPQGASTISNVSMVNNNKELHIGTGNSSTDDTLWTGYTILPQFGVDNKDPVVENARLVGADSTPAMHKIVEDDQYVYGIPWFGTGADDGGTPATNRGTATDNSRIYKFKKNENSYGTTGNVTEDETKGYLTFDSISESKFTRLTALALAYPGLANKNNYRKSQYNDGSDSFLWVYDSNVGDRGTVHLVNRSTMKTEKTYPIMEEFDFYDNDTDYFTDMHEVFLGTGDKVHSGTDGIGASDVNFETALYASAPCTSRTYSGVDAGWDKEDYLRVYHDAAVTTITLDSVDLLAAATVDTPQIIQIGSEYISYTGGNIVTDTLTGCVRGVKILSDGQTLTHDDLDAVEHFPGERVRQENWNQFPDWKYCFLLVPRTDVSTTEIQAGNTGDNRALFKKDFTTNWYHDQQLRPLSVNLINPGNGKYWSVGHKTSIDSRDTGSGGVKLITNQKGFQPPHAVAALRNTGGFIDTDHTGEGTSNFHHRADTTEGMTIAGNNTTDKRSAGWKAIGQWASHAVEANTATVITKYYTGDNGSYGTGNLTVAEVSTGAVRRDMDILITIKPTGGKDKYTTAISSYSNVSDETGSTMHSTSAWLWPKQMCDKRRNIIDNGDGTEEVIDGANYYPITDTNDKYWGMKRSAIPNVITDTKYPSRRASDDVATAWEGLKFSFDTTAFTSGSGTMQWHVTIRTGDAKIDYKPSFIKVTVPRLPFGSVVGNSQQVFDLATSNYTEDAFYPTGYSSQKEDYTFNMIIEPGAAGAGLIIPEHETADGATDHRLAALSNIPFYPLPSGGTWATLYCSAQSSYAQSVWDANYLNGSKMGCNKYFNPQCIGVTSAVARKSTNFQGDALKVMNQKASPASIVSFGNDQSKVGTSYVPNTVANQDRYLLDHGLCSHLGNGEYLQSVAYLKDIASNQPFTISQWISLNHLPNHISPYSYDASEHGSQTIGTKAISIFEIGTKDFLLFAGYTRPTGAGTGAQGYLRLYTLFRIGASSFEIIDWGTDTDTWIPNSEYGSETDSQFLNIIYVKEEGTKVHNLFLNGKKFTKTATDDLYKIDTPSYPNSLGDINMYFSGGPTIPDFGFENLADIAYWDDDLTDLNVAKVYNDHSPMNMRLSANYHTDVSSNLKAYYQFAKNRDSDMSATQNSIWRNDGSGNLNTFKPIGAGDTEELNLDDERYPGIRDLIGLGTVAAWASPLTKNNIYFWGEAMLGSLKATPNTVLLKLLNPPVCFTYTSHFNTYKPDNSQVLFGGNLGHAQAQNYSNHYNLPDDGRVYNGSVVFYLGDTGLVESKLNITGMRGDPFNQLSGGFKGASHVDLSIPFNTKITNLGRHINNYNHRYRSYTWPIIYDVGGSTAANLWKAGANYTHPYTGVLSTTNLTSEDVLAPYDSNVQLTISRTNEGPCDEGTSEANRIKLSTEYKPTHHWDDTVHYSTKILDDRFDASSGKHYSNHSDFDNTIKSFSGWVNPFDAGDTEEGTIISKTNYPADADNIKDNNVNLSGSAFIDCRNYFPITGAVTFSMWVKFNTSLVANERLIAKTDRGLVAPMHHSFDIYLDFENKLMVKFYQNDDLSLPFIGFKTDSAITGADVWKHIVITFNGTDTAIIYLNGVVLANTVFHIETYCQMKIKLVELNQTVEIPLIDDGNAQGAAIDWGDGTTTYFDAHDDAANLTHTYTGAIGTEFDLTVDGIWSGLKMNRDGTGAAQQNNADAFLELTTWGGLTLTGSHTFTLCSNLTILDTNTPLIDATDLSYTFYACSSVNNIGAVNWDVSDIVNFDSMFWGCTVFNDDLSGWDTSSATNMNGMFRSADAFARDINDWHTNEVTTMSLMFAYTDYNGDLGDWNVQKVRDFSSMFAYNNTFNHIGIASWLSVIQAAGTTNMQSMFRSCTAFNVNVTVWNTERVTDMSYMFYNCPAFTRDVSSMDTAAVTDMKYMLYDCFAFNQDISAMDVSAVTDMRYMLAGSSNIVGPMTFNNGDVVGATTVPLTWDTTALTGTGAEGLFQYSKAFDQQTDLYLNNCTSVKNLFKGAIAFQRTCNFSTGGAIWNFSNITDFSSMLEATTFNQAVNGFNMNAATNVSGMFKDNVNFSQHLGAWDLEPTTVSSFLDGCSNFNGSVGEWKMQGVTNMSSMFKGCSSFTGTGGSVTHFKTGGAAGLDADIWDVSNVTTFASMFEGCSVFNPAEIDTWDISSATNLSYMFKNCAIYNQAGLNAAWGSVGANPCEIQNVTTFKGMFEGAAAFNQSIDDWKMTAATTFEDMFKDADAYTQQVMGWSESNGTALGMLNMTTTKGMFENVVSTYGPSHNITSFYINQTGTWTDARNMYKNAKGTDGSSGWFGQGWDQVASAGVGIDQTIPYASYLKKAGYMFYNCGNLKLLAVYDWKHLQWDALDSLEHFCGGDTYLTTAHMDTTYTNWAAQILALLTATGGASPVDGKHYKSFTNVSFGASTFTFTPVTNYAVSDSMTTETSYVQEDYVYDAAASFVTDGVAEGDLVHNITDDKYGIVYTVDSENRLTLTCHPDVTWHDGDGADLYTIASNASAKGRGYLECIAEWAITDGGY